MIYRLSLRVKYTSEQEMNSTSCDKKKVPDNADLFQNNQEFIEMITIYHIIMVIVEVLCDLQILINLE